MKRNRIFYLLSGLILLAAVIFVCVGARSTGPETELYRFSIPVTYEEHGEIKTETKIYYGDYWEETQSFEGYFEDSGMPDMVNMLEKDGNPIWWLELHLEAGYLMGDPAYADFYADGMPQPTMGYYNEEWNEHTGVTEAEVHGIRLIGCEYPQPIENKIVDKGVELEHKAIGILTAGTFVVLLLGLILVKKDEDVVYQTRDKVARILNWVVGVVVLPLLFSCGDGWDLLLDWPVNDVLSALMAPLTVLGICASVSLRRKGRSKLGIAAQFLGLLVFLYLISVNMLVGFGGYLVFFVAGIVVGILLVVRASKVEGAAPKALDKVSLALNIVLIPVYAILSLIMMFMAVLTEASYDAGAGMSILALILSFVIAATPIYCGIALGMSVSLRKKGRSLAGFLVQFVGFVGIVLMVLIGLLPWISISLN